MYSINLNKYWTLFYTKQSKLEFDVLYAVPADGRSSLILDYPLS